MAELDDITRLGALDEAIRAEERAVARAEQRLADEHQRVADAEARTAQIAADQKAARALERELEARMARYSKQLDAALRSLETGIGDPEVSERQRQQSLALIDDVETEILECIENQEHLATQLTLATTEQAEAAALRDVVKAEVETELAERAGRLDGLRSERVPAEAALPADLRGKYALLVTKKGSAVTTVDDQRCCTKCRMLAAAQQLSEVKRGRLENCRGCGRWITA